MRRRIIASFTIGHGPRLSIPALSLLSAALILLSSPQAWSDLSVQRSTQEILQQLNLFNHDDPGVLPSRSCAPSRAAPGCSELLEEFCTELYSPNNQGNLDIKTSSGIIPIRKGRNPRGINHAFLAFQSAKLASMDRLP